MLNMQRMGLATSAKGSVQVKLKQSRDGAPRERIDPKMLARQSELARESHEDMRSGYEKRQHAQQVVTFQKLVLDTYAAVKLLNQIDLGVLEEILAVFRESLFAKDRQALPSQIAEVLARETSEPNSDVNGKTAALVNEYDGNLEQAAIDIARSMQIVIEFLDKGMKGLLSGDMSPMAMKQIQIVIEKHLPKLQKVQLKLDQAIDRQSSQAKRDSYSRMDMRNQGLMVQEDILTDYMDSIGQTTLKKAVLPGM